METTTLGGLRNAGDKGEHTVETGRRFDPTKYLRAIKTRGGRQEMYLPVPARLLWLRSDHPNASVVTEALKLDDRNAIFKATITLPGGAVAVGHGSETSGDFGDFIEKAETKAIGRALAALGYGTDIAELQDDPLLAGATEVLPVTPPAPAPAPVVAPPAPAPQPTQPQPPAPVPMPEASAPRPERTERYERAERNDRTDRPERLERPERFERTERTERTERAEQRPDRFERPERVERTERTERTDRFAPPPRSLMERAPRPERPERAERAEPADVAPPIARPTLIERSLRPERSSRSRELLPAATGEAAPMEIEEEAPPAPTPIRRSGRTLVARPSAAPAAALPAPVPAPEPAALPEPEEPDETDGATDDELEPATISTTSFWRWAKSKGYPDRRAVEAATGRSMDTMTPREAYYRLREVIARGPGQ